MKSPELQKRIEEIKEEVYKIMDRSLEKSKQPDVIDKATSLMTELYELNKIIEHNLPIDSNKQKTLQNKIYRRLKEVMKKAYELVTIESINDVKCMLRSYMRLI